MTPPPYVPLEYRKLKYNEMPEPYKSQIDRWIKHNTAIFERQRKGALVGCVMAGLMTVGVIVFLWVTL